MKISKRKKNNKGMTLIEIIIAMAILAIIGVTFLNVFGLGYIGIISGGKHTIVAYSGQQKTEEAITTATGTTTTSPPIPFPGVAKPIQRTGREVVIIEDLNGDNKFKTEITTFIAIPNP